MSKLDEYLKATGLTKGQITELTADESEFDVKATVNANKDKERENYREVLANDADFVGKIKDEAIKSADGKHHGTIHSAFKAGGLTKEEIEAAEGNIKTLVEAVAAKNKDTSNEDIEKVNEQLRESNRENQRLKDEEIPKIIAEASAKADNSIIDIQLRKHYTGLDPHTLMGDTHEEAWYEAAKFNIDKKYDMKLKDGKIEVYQKGTEYKANNSDNTAPLKYEDVFSEAIGKYVKQSNGNGATPKPNGQPSGTPAGTGGVVNPRMASAIEKGGEGAARLQATATDTE